tara:strand:+ start:99 stop:455 length:357 start_codon:yes stop_codon:yes gene_type:complete
MNDLSITFSAWNAFKKAFVALFAPVHVDDLTDADIQNVMDNATSATAWCDNESEVPDAVQHMNDIKGMLGWKGDIKTTQYTSERNGKERSGFSINLQRDKSRSLGLVAFKERLAGLVR